jgi:gliding motility-associated-like protein
MILKPNIDDDSAVAGRNARFPLLGLLLLSVGLLFHAFQPAIAAPERGKPSMVREVNGYTYTVTVIKDYSVLPGGLDEIEVSVSPVPTFPPGEDIGCFLGATASVNTTDASGNAYFYFTNTTPGAVPVSIYDGTTFIESININFLAQPGPPSPVKSYFAVAQNPANANGVSQDVVEAFLYDQYGNVVPSASVNWSVQSGVASFASSPNTTSQSNGTSTIGLTSTTVGAADVQAMVSYTDPVTHIVTSFQLGDQSGNNFLPVQFVQPQPSPTNSYIVAVITPKPADGTSQDEVQAMVYDASGVPIASGTITFTIETGTATMTTTGTIVNGVATAFFTSTVVGSVQVQGAINGGTLLNDQANPANNFVTVQFTTPPPNPALSYVVAVVTPQPADGTSQDVVKAYVNNASGPVPDGTVVTFTIETGTATITTTGLTVGGVATADLTSNTVGSVQVQAAINGGTFLNDQANPSNNFVTVQFTIPPPSPTLSYVVAVVTPVTADGISRDEVQAVVNNANGPVPDGTVVTFTIETGTATITTTGLTVGGVATAYFTSLVVGSVQVQAAINGSTYLNDQANPTNNYVTIQFVTGQPVTGDPGGPSDGGNPGGGSPVNGGTPPSGGGGTSPGGGNNTGPTSNNGYTLLYIEPAYNYRLSDGQSQDSVFCLVTDAEQHPIAGVAVTFFIQTSPTEGTITSGAQWTITPVNVLTGPDGIARIALTSTSPGTVFVDASIVDPTTNSPALVAGSYQVAVFVTKPDVTNIQTALTVIVGEAMADGVQQNVVKAHIVDVDGNVMPDQEVYFAIDSGTGTIITPQPVMTDANGDAYIQISSKTVGYVLITAVVDSEKIVFGSPARVYFAMINIYVPRAFSPNNDGTNDILRPILVGIQTFHYFNVYNRWGNLIFATQDPNQGWDGTFKGVPQPVETYLWIAEGIDENGRKVVAKGMTSLVR